jgi:hypothetical protein
MDPSKVHIALERNRALQEKLRSALTSTANNLVAIEEEIKRVREPLLQSASRIFPEKRKHASGAEYTCDPITGEPAPKCAAALAKQQVTSL